jgi:zona occludens toxin
MTQSYGKISVAIKDLVQVCYKVRKATAFGRSDQYIRKVLDGVRGSEVATSVRTYLPQYFKLYRSHTQGVSIDEAEPDDVSPFIVRFNRWKWIVLAVGVAACVGVGIKYAMKPSAAELAYRAKQAKWLKQAEARAGKPMSEAEAALPAWATAAGVQPLPGASAPAVVASGPVGAASGPVLVASAAAVPASAKVPEVPEPYREKGLHLVGKLSGPGPDLYVIAVSANGVAQSTVLARDLVKVGYRFEPLSDCVGVLHWYDKIRTIICDAPSIGGGGPGSAGRPST